MGVVDGVGKVDAFVGQLWKGWKQLRDEGIAQESSMFSSSVLVPLVTNEFQTIQLGIFRSDYMLHVPTDADASLRQVEFNTIASSFGPLSERTAAMHR
jgi:hypothetical protein